MQLVFVLFVALSTGCGRINYTDLFGDRDAGAVVDSATGADAAPFDGGPPDSGIDGGPLDGGHIYCDWSSPPTMSTPVVVAELSTAEPEYDPRITMDGLRIYFSRWNASDAQIYVAERPTTGSPFGPPRLLPHANTPLDEYTYNETPDGLTAMLTRDVAGEGANLFLAERSSIAEPFGAWNPIDELNTSADDWDGYLAPNRLEFYFSRGQMLYRATRASTADAFSPPELASELGAVAGGDATMTGDGLTLFFATPDSRDIYYSHRTSTEEPFGPGTAVPGLDDPISVDGHPGVRDDGCELYFLRFVDGNAEIYVTRVL